MNVYISIGAQCATPTLFTQLQLKQESQPFDWMISTPEFVHAIMKCLFVDKKEIEDIVDNDFFLCDKKARLESVEHHILDNNGPVLVNSKYNVCFPHDTLSDRAKYIRRIERFRKILLDKDNFIHFVYMSVSSPASGNFTINGVEPIQQLYPFVEKINDIIKSVRENYKIIVFDTNKPSDIVSPDALHIQYFDISKKGVWSELLPEVMDIFKELKLGLE